MAENKYANIENYNCGIYMIRNTINGKVYIGQSHNIRWRWWAHKSALNAQCGHNPHFQSAWNKYGANAFKLLILETCPTDLLDEREMYWISHYNSQDPSVGYNIKGGGNSCRGWKMPKSFSAWLSERNRRVCTGKKLSESQRKRMSESHKRYYATHDHHCNISVVCLNTGEVFKSAREAENAYPNSDHSSISLCCRGRMTYAGTSTDNNRLVWAYLSDYTQMSEIDIQSRIQRAKEVFQKAQGRTVKCLTTNEVFPSLKAGAEHFGITSQRICAHLKGKAKSAGKLPATNEPLYWAYCG